MVSAAEQPKDGKEQSFVDVVALVSFTERLTKQPKEDFLNEALLAQRTADTVADRTKQEKCVKVLSHIGWVIQSFSFQRHTMQEKSFVSGNLEKYEYHLGCSEWYRI